MVKVPRNILELSKAEKLQFIESFDLVLNDCDGVLWTLTGSIPGIKEGIDVLYKYNKKLAFVTNHSIKTRRKFEESFAELGVKFDFDKHLIEPGSSIVKYLQKINFDKTVFLIGSSKIKKLFEENGIKYIVAVS